MDITETVGVKGHENETPHNEIKRVLTVKESNINEKRSQFSHLLMFMAEVADLPPSLTVSLTIKYPLFLTPRLR